MIYSPSKREEAAVLLAALLSPANAYRSTNGPICERGNERQMIMNRYRSYCAELGLNLAVGNGWRYGDKGGVDVPPDIEVKWSARGDRLIVSKRHMQPHLRYVLVTGRNPYHYVGWAYGSEISIPWMSHATYLPQKDLRPINTLKVRQPLSDPFG